MSAEPGALIEALVTELIARVADKWTMLLIEVLTEKHELRFTRLREVCPLNQLQMLKQTHRSMEGEGLIGRTVYPVLPPRVEYRLTTLGLSLVPHLQRDRPLAQP